MKMKSYMKYFICELVSYDPRIYERNLCNWEFISLDN